MKSSPLRGPKFPIRLKSKEKVSSNSLSADFTTMAEEIGPEASDLTALLPHPKVSHGEPPQVTSKKEAIESQSKPEFEDQCSTASNEVAEEEHAPIVAAPLPRNLLGIDKLNAAGRDGDRPSDPLFCLKVGVGIACTLTCLASVLNMLLAASSVWDGAGDDWELARFTPA